MLCKRFNATDWFKQVQSASENTFKDLETKKVLLVVHVFWWSIFTSFSR